MVILELIPWAFSILLLGSMLYLATAAFRAGEFAGRHEIGPPERPPEASAEDADAATEAG